MKMKFRETREIELDVPIDGPFSAEAAERWANKKLGRTTMLEAMRNQSPADLVSDTTSGWKLIGSDTPPSADPFANIRPPRGEG